MPSNFKTSKKFRCTSQSGLSCMWRIGVTKAGDYKALGISEAKYHGNPVPLAFVPFELSNAVVNGPKFETLDEAEDYVRNL